MSKATVYAVRNGRTFVAVLVRPEQAQCLVAARDGGAYYFAGVGERSIKKAAREPWARTYRTLRALLEHHPNAERRSEYDEG